MVTAIIIAGGYGTRMLPFSRHTPKHLLPVGAEPLIVHQLRRLADAGVDQVVIASGHLGDRLALAVGDGRRWGLGFDRLSQHREDAPLGTGGALAAAFRSVDDGDDDPVVVVNGDLISGHDLSAHLRAAAGSDLCLHVREVADRRAFGSVTVDERATVTRFEEKAPDPGPTAGLVNAGTYVLSPAALRELPGRQPLSLEREVFSAMIRAGARVRAYREQSYFRDVGSPGDLVEASADAVLGRIPGIRGQDARWWASSRAQVADDAVLSGGTAVHDGAVVGPGARLDAVLVLPDARVPAGATLRHTIVGGVT